SVPARAFCRSSVFFLLLILTLSVHAAEIATLVDIDRDVATGCVLHSVAGVDAIVTTEVATTPAGMSVSSLRMRKCAGGVLGPVMELASGWPVPRSEQHFDVEIFLPYAQLGISPTTQARFTFIFTPDSGAPVRVPADGVPLTFGGSARRRSAGPSFQGPLPVADGLLAEWVPSQKIVTGGRMGVWMSIGPDALFLRFEVQPGAPVAVDDDYVAPTAEPLTVDAPGVLANDADPENDALSAELVTPAAHGTVTLSADGSFLYQHDGSSASDAFTYRARDAFSASAPATVTLTPVPSNQRPIGTADHYSTTEGQAVVVAGPGVLANDVDPEGDALTVELDAAPAQGVLALAPNGGFTFTPAPDFFGTATFTYRISDGTTASDPVTVTIEVEPVNDQPSFTADGTVTVAEDAAAYAAAWATAISAGPFEASQILSFDITNNSNPSLFDVQPEISAGGLLTFTVAANAHGSASITVVLTDDGGTANGGVDTSSAATFTITVNPVNDVPAFTLPSSTSVNEDAGAQTVANFATAISAGPADESGQTLTFGVTQTSADATLTFSAAPAIAADGTLTYTATANAYGSATFDVVLTDDGSATSIAHQFTITVNPINDAPSFTIAANPPASAEDGGAQTVNGFAGALSQGPNESGQTLTFQVAQTASTGSLSFSGAPAIDAAGNLTYTASADTHGTATFNVVLTDNGSGIAPHANATGAQPFTITVNPVNDAPAFTLSANATAGEDSGAQTIPNFATAISAGAADESGQTLTFGVTQVSADATLTFTSAPGIAADGTLTFTAAANAYGTATFDVVLTDDGSASSITRQ
ncbi:MAG TPA: Ig-like domain-containing protein, partial [Thermoanaerobaculia bacterium]|nr:Ig-like domain-containing protein [Thermoanaerobaculia bacterium]